ARVAVGVHDHLELDLADAESSRSQQDPIDRGFDILIRNQAHEVDHASTPAARRVPRSRLPLHSRSLGCCRPGMTSVTPSVVRAKHRIWSRSAMLATTGECVARSTCAPYTEDSDWNMVSTARGCMPFSGSSMR